MKIRIFVNWVIFVFFADGLGQDIGDIIVLISQLVPQNQIIFGSADIWNRAIMVMTKDQCKGGRQGQPPPKYLKKKLYYNIARCY